MLFGIVVGLEYDLREIFKSIIYSKKALWDRLKGIFEDYECLGRILKKDLLAQIEWYVT